jgi:spore coat polysaccharide biosynthesis protein SpsF
MASTRLPGKSLAPVLGRPLLYYVTQRLKQLKHPVEVVVATSEEESDDPIEAWCLDHQVLCFRGSHEDVLDRYLKAARRFSADVIVRITGDCPLIDPVVVDQAIDQFLEHYPDYDYLSNTVQRTFPRGLDVEVFKRSALERAHEEAFHTEEREHVTPYLWRHPETFSLGSLYHKEDLSDHRWTVDTEDDFALITKLIEAAWPKNRAFTFQELLKLVEAHPEWEAMNAHIKQKGI